MKVLFLDIDGVVNSEETLKKSNGGIVGIDPYLAFIVGKIVLDTECKVVLSSSWRHSEEGREQVKNKVTEFIDITPNSKDGVRGWEIRTWLMKHPEVTRYVIIDDESTDMLYGQPLFKTEWKTGITKEIAKAVTDYLNN